MRQMGTRLLINVHQFSDCLTENNTAYKGNDLNNGSTNIQPDVESCRASCGSIEGAYYFTHWTSEAYNKQCWCKGLEVKRKDVDGKVSGGTCQGEMSFPNHAFAQGY